MDIMRLIQQLMGSAQTGGGLGRGGLGGGQGMVGSLPDFATGRRMRRPPIEQQVGITEMNTIAGPQYGQNDIDAGAPVIPGNNPIVGGGAPQSSMDMMALMHQLAQRGRMYTSGRGRGRMDGGMGAPDPYLTPPTVETNYG
jgi:hypothetical protein